MIDKWFFWKRPTATRSRPSLPILLRNAGKAHLPSLLFCLLTPWECKTMETFEVIEVSVNFFFNLYRYVVNLSSLTFEVQLFYYHEKDEQSYPVFFARAI